MRKRDPRTAKVITQAEAKRYRAALEEIAADTRGKNAMQIAERHVSIAREALQPGYGAIPSRGNP